VITTIWSVFPSAEGQPKIQETDACSKWEQDYKSPIFLGYLDF